MMNPSELSDQVVLITGQKFRVTKAFDLGDEWSLVGYWLDGDKEPEVPHIQHVMVPPALIVRGAASGSARGRG